MFDATLAAMSAGASELDPPLWARHMRAQGLSPATIEARLGELARWTTRIGDPRDPTRATPGALMDMLDDRALAAGTRVGVLARLHAYYAWAGCGFDPTSQTPRPKVPAYLPRPTPETDVAIALAAATGRLRVMVGLAALAGLRVAEIAMLRWDHVDLVARRLRVLGKGNKVRVVPIHRALLEILDEQPQTGPWVVMGRHGRHLSAAYCSDLIWRHLRACGIDGQPHELRHRFATVLYHSTRDVLVVQQALGHSKVTSTQGYAQVAAVDVAAGIDAMPAPLGYVDVDG
jgi:integrase/recombinase XerD